MSVSKWVSSGLAIVWAILGLSPSAEATLIPVPVPFFTAPGDGMLTFTYEGYSAWDTDQMVFGLNGYVLFTNETEGVGTVVQQAVKAGHTYQLRLNDNSTGDTWVSNPAANSDGYAHLASTSTFSDFGLGATAPTPVSTGCALVSGCYFGWEDRPGPGADHDFNDLVFALQFIPTTTTAFGDPVPEPAAMELLAGGLLGLAIIARQGRSRRLVNRQTEAA